MGKGKDAGQLVVGVILVVLGVAWYFVRVPLISDVIKNGFTGDVFYFWQAFLIVFAAIFGLILLFAGAVLGWMGYDGIRTSIETDAET